jgi:UDP-N-acetylglucosamine acyltransferase
MAYVHIAHDCQVGDHTIFANNASIAGHVVVGDWVMLGGFTTAHQFCRIGAHALTSMFSYVTKDIPAFVTVAGRPATPRGINAEGLKRRDYDAAQIRNIREAYRTLYRRGLKLDEALAELAERATTQQELRPLIESVRDSRRGLAR